MSELTRCNRCLMDEIYARYLPQGKVITLDRNGPYGGVDVLVHEPGESLKGKRDQLLVAWFKDLPKKCCC